MTPGITDTSLWASLPEASRAALFEGAATRLPTGFVAELEDVAAAFLHVMRSRYVTGAILHTDGGAFVS